MRIMMMAWIAIAVLLSSAIAVAQENGPFCSANKCECKNMYCAGLVKEVRDDANDAVIGVYSMSGGDPALNGTFVYVEIVAKGFATRHWNLNLEFSEITGLRLVKTGLFVVSVREDVTPRNKVEKKDRIIIAHYAMFDGDIDLSWKVKDKPHGREEKAPLTMPERRPETVTVKPSTKVYLDRIRPASANSKTKASLDAMSMIVDSELKRALSKSGLPVLDRADLEESLPKDVLSSIDNCSGLPCIATALGPHGFGRFVGGRMSSGSGEIHVTMVVIGADGTMLATHACKSTGAASELLACLTSANGALGLTQVAVARAEQDQVPTPEEERPPPEQSIEQDFFKTGIGALPDGWVASQGTLVRSAWGSKALVSKGDTTVLVPIQFVPDNFTLEIDVRFTGSSYETFVVWLGNLSFGIQSSGESWLGDSAFRFSKMQKYKPGLSLKERTTIKLFKKGPVFQLSIGGVGAAMIRKEDFEPGGWLTIHSDRPYAMYWLKLLPFQADSSGVDVRPSGRLVYTEDFADIEEGHRPPAWKGCKTLAVTKSNWFGGGNVLANFQEGNHYFGIEGLTFSGKSTARFVFYNRASCCKPMKFSVDGHYFGLHTSGDSYLGSKKFRLPRALPFRKDYAVVEYVKDGELGRLFLNGVFLGMVRQSSPPTGKIAFSYEGALSLGKLEVWSSPPNESSQKELRIADLELAAVAWKDESQGMAMGKGGVAVRTADGGQSWNVVDTGISDDIIALDYKPGGLLQATAAKRVWLSGDVDAPWKTRELYGIAWFSVDEGLRVKGTVLQKTTDGGITWKKVRRFKKPIEGVGAAGADFWLVAELQEPRSECEDSNVLIHVTVDGGGSWKALKSVSVRSRFSVSVRSCGALNQYLCVDWEPGYCCSSCFCGCNTEVVRISSSLDTWTISELSSASALRFGGAQTACVVDTPMIHCTSKKAGDSSDFGGMPLPKGMKAEQILDLSFVGLAELRLVTKRANSYEVFASNDLGGHWRSVGNVLCQHSSDAADSALSASAAQGWEHDFDMVAHTPGPASIKANAVTTMSFELEDGYEATSLPAGTKIHLTTNGCGEWHYRIMTENLDKVEKSHKIKNPSVKYFVQWRDMPSELDGETIEFSLIRAGWVEVRVEKECEIAGRIISLGSEP